jgi:uncharacterized protein (TIGR02246 family)
MRARWLGGLAAVGLAGTIGCSPAHETLCAPGPAAAAARPLVAQASAAYAESVQRGDVSKIGATFTEDAAMMMPSLEPVIGRQQIERLLAQALNGATGIRYILTPDEILVFGDGAVERGRYSLNMTTNGQPFADRGKYVQVWRRLSDGTWKLAQSITNTSLPPPPK